MGGVNFVSSANLIAFSSEKSPLTVLIAPVAKLNSKNATFHISVSFIESFHGAAGNIFAHPPEIVGVTGFGKIGQDSFMKVSRLDYHMPCISQERGAGTDIRDAHALGRICNPDQTSGSLS